MPNDLQCVISCQRQTTNRKIKRSHKLPEFHHFPINGCLNKNSTDHWRVRRLFNGVYKTSRYYPGARAARTARYGSLPGCGPAPGTANWLLLIAAIANASDCLQLVFYWVGMHLQEPRCPLQYCLLFVAVEIQLEIEILWLFDIVENIT